MPTKQVTIQGIMTWDESTSQPPYPSTGPGFPTNPIAPGGQPPGVWIPAFPTNPIAPGGPPPGIWPSPGHPSHPIAPGGERPTHPIAPGGGPPGIWGGPPLYPDQGLPGQQPGIWPGPGLPPIVSNPISGGGYIVGWSPYFGAVFIPVGGAPPAGSGEPPVPTHPIVEPPPEGTDGAPKPPDMPEAPGRRR
jgi:hypothetical protein